MGLSWSHTSDGPNPKSDNGEVSDADGEDVFFETKSFLSSACSHQDETVDNQVDNQFEEKSVHLEDEEQRQGSFFSGDRTSESVNSAKVSKSTSSITEKCASKWKESAEKWMDSSWRVHPFTPKNVGDIDIGKEGSTFTSTSVPREDKTFSYELVTNRFDSAGNGIYTKSEVKQSCAWEIDVDSFQSQKKSKVTRLSRSKRHYQPDSKIDFEGGSLATKVQGLSTKNCLIPCGCITQEMMAARKLLDLRRW